VPAWAVLPPSGERGNTLTTELMEQVREQAAAQALGPNIIRAYAELALKKALAYQYDGYIVEAMEQARFATDLLQQASSMWPYSTLNKQERL
jgi:hypothetical protein